MRQNRIYTWSIKQFSSSSFSRTAMRRVHFTLPTLPQSLFAEQVVQNAQKAVREDALQTGHRQFLVDIQPLVWILACPFQLSLTFLVGTLSSLWASWQAHYVLPKALCELKKCANFFSFWWLFQ